MFGSKKAVNQRQIDELVGLLHQVAQTPDHAEQDVLIAEVERFVPQLDRATVKGFDKVSPDAYLAIEANHISSVTGESLESATKRLDDALRELGKRAYGVFFWPDPSYVIDQLRKAGELVIGWYEPQEGPPP